MADPVADEGSESDEAPAPVRKCTGRRSEEWKILTATEGTRQTAQEALTDILRMQSETFGFAQHQYQRVAGTGVLDHGDLWQRHCKNMRKYSATLKLESSSFVELFYRNE